MSYILSDQADDDDVDLRENWRLYQENLRQNQHLLPKRVCGIATSVWWYRFEIPEAPHDATLIRYEFTQKYTTRGSRDQLVLELESGFGGRIILTYTGVIEYRIHYTHDEGSWGGGLGWRYDEFRSNGKAGEFIHAIDWGTHDPWIIRARNLRHRYIPEKKKKPAAKTPGA